MYEHFVSDDGRTYIFMEETTPMWERDFIYVSEVIVFRFWALPGFFEVPQTFDWTVNERALGESLGTAWFRAHRTHAVPAQVLATVKSDIVAALPLAVPLGAPVVGNVKFKDIERVIV